MKKLTQWALVVAMTLATSMAFAVGVTIDGDNTQTVTVDNAMNFALGKDAIAEQTLASNRGNITINGDNNQTLEADNVMNFALGSGAQARQTISSNDSH